MYKLQLSKSSGEVAAVSRTDDSGQVWFIPFDPANTDYQAYLAWLAEGNEPLPADAPTE